MHGKSVEKANLTTFRVCSIMFQHIHYKANEFHVFMEAPFKKAAHL